MPWKKQKIQEANDEEEDLRMENEND